MARPRLTPLWLPAIALAAAAALVLSLSPTGAPELTPDTERLKGLAPRLVVHRRAGARVESLDAQSRLRAGDTLQLGYVAAGRRFVAIVSLDGRGALTQHWPRDGVDAVESAGPQEIVLPDAYRLDDAPGFERFVLLSSDAPFSLGALTATPWSPEAARRAALPLPPSVEQTSLLLEKESP